MSSGGAWRPDRAVYDRLLSLPYSGWGWEFKRRDPALKSARRRAGALRPLVGRRADGATLFRLTQRCHVAEAFGLHFIPDTSQSAFETTPFWLPEVMSASFPAAFEVEARLKAEARYLRWDEVPGKKYFLIAPGRSEKLVIRVGGYAAQLVLDGDGLPLAEAACFSLKLGAGQLVGSNLRQVEEFARACLGSSARPKPARATKAKRLRDALIALDGELAGVRRREIGEAIFGAEVVKDDWDGGVNSYKQRTKRLVDKGFALMRSGYRKLL